MAVRAVTATGTPARRRRHTPGKVEKAARKVLLDIDTDHAAADLLMAVATRLAQDVDEATEVRDRVAASKELRELIEALDTAVIPPAVPGVPEGGADDDDDPFAIGAVPPGMVNAEEPEAS